MSPTWVRCASMLVGPIWLWASLGNAVAASAQPRPHGDDAPPLSPSQSPAPRAELVRELERLTEGLTLMSESDFPLDVVTWRRPGERPSAERLAALTGHPHPETATTMTVDDFFRAALAAPRARGEPEGEREAEAVARRFGRIVLYFKTRLADVRVFRFGHLTIRAYVVGTTSDGDWIGLATTQIET